MDSLTLSNNEVNIAISGTFKRDQNSGTFEVSPGEINHENKINLMNYLAAHATAKVLVFSTYNGNNVIYECLVIYITPNSNKIGLKLLTFY